MGAPRRASGPRRAPPGSPVPPAQGVPGRPGTMTDAGNAPAAALMGSGPATGASMPPPFSPQAPIAGAEPVTQTTMPQMISRIADVLQTVGPEAEPQDDAALSPALKTSQSSSRRGRLRTGPVIRHKRRLCRAASATSSAASSGACIQWGTGSLDAAAEHCRKLGPARWYPAAQTCKAGNVRA